jgi:molybdopterin molybdotransferase
MITVEEARRIIMQHVPVMPAEFRVLEQTVGAFLAEDAFAAADHPRFDMSAVDGYAVGGPDGPWRLVGRVAAGSRFTKAIGAGECVRILTGSAVPRGTAGVIMQEHTRLEGDTVTPTGSPLLPGAHIRRQGEAFRTGELLIGKGERIGPARVGLLASAGLEEVMVAIEPSVAVVRTGSEFLDDGPDAREDHARIHSSNDRMLIAAIRQAWMDTGDVPYTAEDDHAALATAIRQAAAAHDVVVATGGASVGDHDLLRPVLEELGAVVHFHGVRQKPGKPMLFATLGRTPVFGLPGNPRAVLVCWYAYVLPFLHAMQGAVDPWLRTERLPLMGSAHLKGERAEFRAAMLDDGMVHLLPDEGSHMLTTMALADGLAYFPPGASGEHFSEVEFIHLPEP